LIFLTKLTHAFLAAALTRVMRAAVPIPAIASASVLQTDFPRPALENQFQYHSVRTGLNTCELGVFRF